MIYKEYLPSESLREVIINYWKFEYKESDRQKEAIQHETIPDSCTSIVFIDQPYYNGIRILGPHTKKYQQTIFPGSVFFGIRIAPWVVFTPELFSKNEIVNNTSDSNNIIKTHFGEIDKDIFKIDHMDLDKIEEAFTKLINNVTLQENQLIKFICIELTKGRNIYDLIEEIPLSIRVIQKLFKNITGITMKQFAGNNRMRNTWKSIVTEDKEKLDVILENNYYDQSHFLNDFKKRMSRPSGDFESYLQQIDISLV